MFHTFQIPERVRRFPIHWMSTHQVYRPYVNDQFGIDVIGYTLLTSVFVSVVPLTSARGGVDPWSRASLDVSY